MNWGNNKAGTWFMIYMLLSIFKKTKAQGG